MDGHTSADASLPDRCILLVTRTIFVEVQTHYFELAIPKFRDLCTLFCFQSSPLAICLLRVVGLVSEATYGTGH